MTESPPQTTDRSSVALGLAALVIIAVLVVAVRVVGATLGAEAGPTPACCVVPVEIVDDEGPRLGCAMDAELASCGSLAKGDRATLAGGRCSVTPGGMAAGMRLLQGLKLDVNRVSEAELALVEGIGPRLAAALVAERGRRGRFASLDDLDQVPGVGEATLARLREVLEIH